MNTSGQNQQSTKKPAQKHAQGVGNFVFNPGLGGVVRPLAESFQMFRSLLAMLFLSSGMLDKTHPFFRPGVNYTLSDIYNETRARFDWKDKTKLPQNIFFIAVWGLLGACALWVVTLIFSLMIGTANAAEGGAAAACLFCAPEGDLATTFLKNLIMGDQINSGPDANPAYPVGPAATGMIQAGLRGMLEFYSSAILAFASFILLYHVINMVVQAAWSGKALEGSAQIWAPLRLVLAIGLLVPISSGLNAAQFMTLKIAEMGSGIATQAWHKFGEAMTSSASPEQASASIGSVHASAQTMFQIYTCMYEINFAKNKMVAALPEEVVTGVGNPLGLGDAVVQNWRLDPLWGNTVKMMVGDSVSKESCGAIVMPRRPGDGSPTLGAVGAVTNPAHGAVGAAPPSSRIGSKLEELKAPIRNGIAEASETLRQNMQYIACETVRSVRTINENDNIPANACASGGVAAPSPCDGAEATAAPTEGSESQMARLVREGVDPAQRRIACAVNNYYNAVETSIQEAFTPNESGESLIDQMLDIENSSWIEAGTYFMMISAVQNAITSAASAAPTASPGRTMNMSSQFSDHVPDRFDGNCDRGRIGDWANWLIDEQKDYICRAKPYAKVANDGVSLLSQQQRNSGSAIQVGGLFEAGKGSIINFFAGPALSDPIGALFSFGHMLYLAAAGLITTAIAAMAGGGVVGGLLSAIPVVGGALGGAVTGAADAYAKLAIPLGFLALGMSFPLAFLLPILPLARFLGTVMSWLLAVFEAVVSMPLFALAHLNPSGNSLFAPASTGYQYLFHIAIKPILLVFGMIGAILVLPIVLYALNYMFVPALDAAWGDNEVTIVTKALFFIAYATVAYGFVNISLKAVDDLSQKSVRWANFQPYDFRNDSEAVGNSAAQAQYATTAFGHVNKMASGLGSGLAKQGNKLGTGVGKAIGGIGKKPTPVPGGGGTGGGALPPGGGTPPPGGPTPSGPKPKPMGMGNSFTRGASRMGSSVADKMGSLGGPNLAKNANAAYKADVAKSKEGLNSSWADRQGLRDKRDEARKAYMASTPQNMAENKAAYNDANAAFKEKDASFKKEARTHGNLKAGFATNEDGSRGARVERGQSYKQSAAGVGLGNVAKAAGVVGESVVNAAKAAPGAVKDAADVVVAKTKQGVDDATRLPRDIGKQLGLGKKPGSKKDDGGLT